MRLQWAKRISLENLRPLASLLADDLAIDLGTVNTRVYARGRGIVVNEPSAVALDDSTGEVQAVGKEAKEMLGRTPGRIRVINASYDINLQNLFRLQRFFMASMRRPRLVGLSQV